MVYAGNFNMFASREDFAHRSLRFVRTRASTITCKDEKSVFSGHVIKIHASADHTLPDYSVNAALEVDF